MAQELVSVKPSNDAEWKSWAAQVRKGQMKAQGEAWKKLGKKPPIFKLRAHGEERTAAPVKIKPKRQEKEQKEAGVSRSTGLDNSQGFACPTCWGVPKNVRNDGFTIARHLPANPEAKRYRDTEFCDGQGKIGVAVMSQGWQPGSEPKQKMSAKKWRQGKGEKK